MFGIGGFELFIILIFGFLIFGPDKLPEIARTVGKGIARFREAQKDMNDALGNEKIFDPNNPDEPFKDPIEALDKLAQHQEEKRKEKEGGASAKAASEKAAPAQTAPVAGVAGAGDEGQAAEDDSPRQESFTERKARYERERAARKAAEAKAAEEAKATGQPTASDRKSVV